MGVTVDVLVIVGVTVGVLVIVGVTVAVAVIVGVGVGVAHTAEGLNEAQSKQSEYVPLKTSVDAL